MKILLTFVVALSLAVGPVASAAEQSSSGSVATAAAKKKKKKSKKKQSKLQRCNAKARKKKGKARSKALKVCKRKYGKKKAKKKPPAPAAPSYNGPLDYSKLKLSERKYEVQKDEPILLPMADGRSVYIEVYRPKTEGKYGVILESSPYHGTLYNREGWRILPQPRKPDSDEPQGLVGYFVPRGYVVVMMDLRGTGKSQGCLDHLGPKDASDLKTVVEWAAGQGWSNGKVGMVGHSYVGSTPAVAAAQNPKGLETVVLSAGLASMYDHQYQWGVPWFLQWAGPVYGYQGLALDRALPPGQTDPATGAPTGDNFGNNPEEAACGMTQNALLTGESMSSGQYVGYHAERDWREGVKKWGGKVWVVHGVNDDAARIASIAWFAERGLRAGDKFWLGQWDHGIGCCPTRRGLQWTMALHAWFDKHLLGRDVDTGPQLEAFINDETEDPAAIEGQSEAIIGKEWPVPSTPLTLSATPSNGLATGSAEEGQLTFEGNADGFNNRYEGGVDFVSEPLIEDTVIIGIPKLDVALTQTVERMHLVATLYQESSDGTKRRISTCAMNPELREGIDKITPVTPTRMTVSPPCFSTAHRFKAGTKIGLKVNTSDTDHAPTHAAAPLVIVYTGAEGTKITLPTISPAGKVFKDAINLEAEGFAGSGA